MLKLRRITLKDAKWFFSASDCRWLKFEFIEFWENIKSKKKINGFKASSKLKKDIKNINGIIEKRKNNLKFIFFSKNTKNKNTKDKKGNRKPTCFVIEAIPAMSESNSKKFSSLSLSKYNKNIWKKIKYRSAIFVSI